jgi:PAS domain S-box-containing protein
MANDPFLDFFENAPVALHLVDREGIIIHANKAELALLGYSREEYVGHKISEFYLNDRQAEAALKTINHGGVLKDFRAALVRKDGSVREVLIDSNGCFEKDEFLYSRCFTRDVTDAFLKAEQTKLQHEVTKVLVAATTIVDALSQIMTVLCESMGFEVGLVWKVNEPNNRMSRIVQMVADSPRNHDYLLARSVNVHLSIASGFPSSVWFAGHGQTLDHRPGTVCFNEPDSRILKTYTTIVAFPISVSRKGWGIVGLFSQNKVLVTAEHLEMLSSIGFQIGQFVDRTEAYEAFLKSQERYYVAITGSNDGIWDWDLMTNETFFSPRYKAQLGFEEKELANHFDTFRDLCHPEDYPRVIAAVNQHLEHRAPYDVEFRMRTRAGDYKWISARGQAIWNNQGRPIRMAGSHRDISELKAAEQERRAYEQRLSESEAMFRQLTENIGEVFWIANATTGRFIYASPAFEEVWERKCSEIYEDRNVFFQAMVDEDRERVEKAMVASSFDKNHSLELEFRIKTDRDEIRWIWSRVFPVLNETGALDRLCGIAHDITEKKEVERRVSEFYSTVSHELRTPLTSIRAALGLIEGGLTGEIPEETLEYTRIARENSDRLIRLINDILDIRKLEANKLELKIAKLRPEDIVNQTVTSLKAFADERAVGLFVHANNKHLVLADPDRLTQILTNLVSNAIKYTAKGKAVNVQVSDGDSSVIIKVVDQGPGISSDNMPDLFGPFQQLSCIENEVNTGSGLGLAISKALVEKQGGRIGVESTPGEGAAFWVELPAIATTARSVKESGEPLILLVEDSNSIAMLLKTFLTRKGYTCVRAANIGEARTLANDHNLSLVFADVNLPDGNGLDFVNWLHNSQPDKIIPVIVLSGAEPDTDRVDHPEFVDWVKKPFDGDQILSLLKLRAAHNGGPRSVKAQP